MDKQLKQQSLHYERIPSEIKLGGQIVEVKEVEQINGSALGESHLCEGSIEIAKTFFNTKERTQSESSKTNTFYHELIHCILQTMGENELDNNEKFVCGFAGFLADAMENARFIEHD